MKAWRITERQKIELIDMGAQTVSPNCVKLKMLTVMVDTAETALYNDGANLPLIAGRDGVGMVIEVGTEVSGFKRGDKVYVRPVSNCGKCVNCKSGNAEKCENTYVYGETEDGVLRDFISVPARDLILLPPQVDETQGAFIGQVAMAAEALDKLKIEKGEHIVIMGATMIGLIMAQMALYYQAVPILIDLRQDRLELAQSLGVYYTVNAVREDPVKRVFSITCGKMAETMAYSLMSGMPVKRAFDNLCCGGRMVFVGYKHMKSDLKADLAPALEKNLTIKMVSSCADNYYSAVNMLVSKAVSVDALVSSRVPFEKADEAIREVSESVMKNIAVLVETTKI